MKDHLSAKNLLNHKHWIFDMDGTLTIAQHDFDAIRDELGLPEGLPILESLDAMPKEVSTPLHQRLNEIELEIAADSKPAKGAEKLLETLINKGANIGILTRNNKTNIDVTLNAAGLKHYFVDKNLLSRDCAKPKPAPDGILQLLKQWNAELDEDRKQSSSVMVGDHLHDLLSGRAAGCKTLYVDPQGQFIFKRNADVCVHQLTELFS